MGAVELSGVALLSVMMILLLREWRPGMAAPLRLAVVLLLTGASVGLFLPVVARVRALLSLSSKGELGAPIMRAAGVALLTELTASFCRDLGENGVAEGVLLFGRLEILVLCLPLVDTLIDIAGELLG